MPCARATVAPSFTTKMGRRPTLQRASRCVEWFAVMLDRLARYAGVAAFVLVLAACLGSSGSSGGSIGAVLVRDNITGVVEVRDAPDGRAASNAGLREGDRVKMIDGVHVDELDKGRIRELLRGPVGSKVTLTVVRGDEVVHINVTREALGAAQAVKERHERIE